MYYLQIATAVCVLSVVRLLAKFYDARQGVWRLQRANMPMPEFKLVAGHFPALKQAIQSMPPNSTLHSVMLKLSRQFPSDIFYINMWPFSRTWMVVATPSAALQIQKLNLAKPAILRRPLETITGGPSLISMHGDAWKQWRALFNPGFNPAYLIGLTPTIAGNVAVFCDQLRKRACENELFLLEPLTLRLRVDTICAVALDAQLGHQTKDPW